MSADPALLFASIVGSDAVQHSATGPLSGRTLPLVTPANRAEFIAVVQAAAQENVALYVRSGGSEARQGRHSGPAAILSTRRLDQVIDHARDDLTFSAEAGLTLSAAQALLRPCGQRLTLTPRSATTTLGGTMARAAEGWTRSSCGLVRDQILGCEVVTGEGKVITAGGRVVKNVSGYDLCRLFTGSRAAFGVVLSLTLRLRAMPEARRMTLHPAKDFAAALALARDLDAAVRDAELVRVRLTQADDGAPATCAVLVSLAGAAARVQEAAEQVAHIAGAGEVLGSGTPDCGATVRCCVQVLPEDTAAAAHAMHAVLTGGAGHTLECDVATGTIVHCTEADGAWTVSQRDTLATALRSLDALVQFPSDPIAHWTSRTEFGACDEPTTKLLRGLAARFDPRGIMEPGANVWR